MESKSNAQDKNAEDCVENLSDMFDKALKMYNDLSNTDKSTNSPEVQSQIKYLIKTFETATKLVSAVDMFSSNESFEDVPTENVKYFLLPALLGLLTLKICDSTNRMNILDVAEIYFLDFLKRIKMYNIVDVNIPETDHQKKERCSAEESSSAEEKAQKANAQKITELVNARQTKIQRYKYQKELEKKLDSLKSVLENDNIDDENKREYFVTLIKIYSNQALEELSSLATEKTILEHIENNKDETGKPKVCKSAGSASKLKPIIITRNEIQKQVYGAGYPSLPVLTVDEFYEQRIKDGDWPGPAHPSTSKSLQDTAQGNNAQDDKEEEEKEKKIETDDPEYLAQVRSLDEYKDSHRRGWGNRYNRS